MIAFDSNIWIARFDPLIRAPIDPSTDVPIEFAQERVKGLIAEAARQKTTIIVPTPVLSEVLVYASKRRFELLSLISGSSAFLVSSFDEKAAIELAEMNLDAATGDKKFGSEDPYQKVKVDRQIAAICKTRGCETLCTTDRSLANFARRFGMNVKHLADIPVPEGDRQLNLSLGSTEE